MSERMTHELLLSLLGEDQALFSALREHGVIAWRDDEAGCLMEQAEDARVAALLLKDLDVNWEGVEVILHLRHQLLETRARLAQAMVLLRGGTGLP